MHNSDIQSCGVLRVRKEKLTFPSLRTFYESSSALIESGVRELIIDLSDVTYIDSASLGCLMDVCRTMSNANGVVKLIGLQERVQALATLAGMTPHMEGPEECRFVHDCPRERILG
jgi:anti-anti-sigma factor